MTYAKNCIVCDGQFKSQQPGALYCKAECRKKNYQRNTGKYATYSYSINKNSAGALSELEVACDLIKKGYAVFRQMSLYNVCDLVAVKDNRVLLIEARTGYISNCGTMTFPPKIHDVATHFAVYFATEDKVRYFSRNKEEVNL